MNRTPTERARDVHSGSEVFSGTRVPVRVLVEIMKAGGSLQEFLDGFPSVKPWQVEAVLSESDRFGKELQDTRRGFLTDLKAHRGDSDGRV